MTQRPVVGVLWPGEMGHAIGRVLVGRGVRVVTSLEGRGARTKSLAAVAGIEDAGSVEGVVRESDVIFSVTASAAAPTVGREVAQSLADRDNPLLFVECNALAPQTVRKIAATVGEAGGHVVDVGIVGGPPTDHRGPKFYASGPHADELLGFRELGLDVRPIGPDIGQASGLKMCYAALTKGLSALGTELLLAAARLDLLDALLAEFGDSQPVVLDWLERAIPGMPPKSRRWVSEMEEIAATLGELGLGSGYHLAAANLFRWVGQTSLAQERPESRDESRTMRQVIEELALSSHQR
jgi:3-hydroxyisobutyrate dehydrogenase-like beta-hydroxyacid dehydrogenase